MQAWGVSESELRNIAGNLGIGIEFGNPKGNAINFTLKWLPDNPYVSRGDGNRYRHKSINIFHERWTRAVCFHGHFDFMYEVFDIYAHEFHRNVRIKSGYYGTLDYQGFLDFQIKAYLFARSSIGAPVMPLSPVEYCDCHSTSHGIKHDIDWKVVSWCLNRGWEGWPARRRKKVA